ncbi:MAG: hypothetical protein KDE61_08545, partial [Novosphingobium sp.]|nr:hypothetical protein [Novosphingobium sp.]
MIDPVDLESWKNRLAQLPAMAKNAVHHPVEEYCHGFEGFENGRKSEGCLCRRKPGQPPLSLFR